MLALTELYGDVNALHPFREGNGRALRAFSRHLAAEAGWDLRWAVTTSQQNTEASIRSMYGDNSLLCNMLDKAVVSLAS